MIVNFSVLDFFWIFFIFFVFVGVFIKRWWVFGDVFCYVNGFYIFVFLVVFFMLVMFISVNRYFLIVWVSESFMFFSLWWIKVMIFIFWFLVVFIVILLILGWGYYGFFVLCVICFIVVGSSYLYISFLVIIFIIILFFVFIWCYVKIYKVMKRSKNCVECIWILLVNISLENVERLKKEVGWNLF